MAAPTEPEMPIAILALSTLLYRLPNRELSNIIFALLLFL